MGISRCRDESFSPRKRKIEAGGRDLEKSERRTTTMERSVSTAVVTYYLLLVFLTALAATTPVATAFSSHVVRRTTTSSTTATTGRRRGATFENHHHQQQQRRLFPVTENVKSLVVPNQYTTYVPNPSSRTTTTTTTTTAASATVASAPPSFQRRMEQGLRRTYNSHPTWDVNVLTRTLITGAVPKWQALWEASATVNGAAVRNAAQRYGWALPSLLCAVPVYTYAVWRSLPTTPAVWKLVNVDFVHSHGQAASILSAFLASNLSYLMAAAYLWRESSSSTVSSTISSTISSSPVPRRALGGWLLAAGITSTVFHTVQAYGDFRLAEALCYFDHGIAGTAILYFWSTCGRPSLRTWGLGSAGLLALAFPSRLCPPLYTWLHSLWHLLSALSAVVWVRDALPAFTTPLPTATTPSTRATTTTSSIARTATLVPRAAIFTTLTPYPPGEALA